MAKKFSEIKNQTDLRPINSGWAPVDTYHELRLRLGRRNLWRMDHQLILEPMRAIRFLRQYQDTGRSTAEVSDVFCLGLFGLIEVRGNRTLVTNAGRRLLEETKSWTQLQLIRGSSSPWRYHL